MAKLHAFDYLGQPEKYPPKPVCVAYGDELFLRRQVLLGLRHAVLGDDEGEFSLTTFEGRTTEFREVIDELSTMSMFGGQRLVVVENADAGARNRATASTEGTPTGAAADEEADDSADKSGSGFVARYRQQIEDYVARPGRSGVFVLDVKSWPSNTRLYKAVDAHGLAVDCSSPKEAALGTWLKSWAKQSYDVQLAPGTGELLVEMIGPELGLLDQELAKLAVTTASDKKITPEMVKMMAGGWRAKTTWDMLDLALDGNAAEALRQIDRLLASGDASIKLLAQISASLRRLAAATRLILQAETAGRRIGVGPALEKVGVNRFFLKKTEAQLRRLGRQRGSQLYRWLLEADLDLKGDSQMPPRLILERLIVRLAARPNRTQTDC